MRIGIPFLDTIGLYRLHLSLCMQGSIKHHSTFNKTFVPSPFFPFLSFFLVEITSLFTAPAVGERGRGYLQLASTDCAASSLVALTAHRLPHFSKSLISLSSPALGLFFSCYSCIHVSFQCAKFLHFAYRLAITPCVLHPHCLLNQFI